MYNIEHIPHCGMLENASWPCWMKYISECDELRKHTVTPQKQSRPLPRLGGLLIVRADLERENLFPRIHTGTVGGRVWKGSTWLSLEVFRRLWGLKFSGESRLFPPNWTSSESGLQTHNSVTLPRSEQVTLRAIKVCFASFLFTHFSLLKPVTLRDGACSV